MASNDEAITKADLQELKVYIDGKFAEVDGRFAVIEGRLTNLEKRLDSSVSELKTEIRVNAARIEGLRDFMGWGFAALGIVVALVGFTITLAPMFREMFKERRNSVSRDEVREMIREREEELMKLKGSLA